MPKIFTKYTSIEGFLKRFTLLKFGKLHIRTHTIESCDNTNLLHCHPFHYMSIILKGGYKEIYEENGELITKERKAPCIIISSKNRFHRIEKIYSKTLTLFFAYGKYGWQAKQMGEHNLKDGIFKCIVKDEEILCKRENGIWFIGHNNYTDAKKETRHSIFQGLPKETLICEITQ